MDNIASAYEGLENFARAQDLYEGALRITRKLRSDSHPDTALAHNNLAAVLLTTHQYARANDHLASALSTYRAVLGEQHPRTATVLFNVARLNEEEKNFDAAVRLHLAADFKQVGAFWAERNVSDAATFSKTPETAANDLAAAVQAGDDAKVQSALQTINGTCGGCHMAHREGSSGSFKMK